MIATRYINPYLLYKDGEPSKYEYTFIVYRKETMGVLERTGKNYPWSYMDAQLVQDAKDILSNFESDEEKDYTVIMDWADNYPLE